MRVLQKGCCEKDVVHGMIGRVIVDRVVNDIQLFRMICCYSRSFEQIVNE